MVDPQPSINVIGIRFDEPVTVLTDLLVSAVCLYAYKHLWNLKHDGSAQRYFRWYFLLMAVATFLGGIIGHGFLYAFSFSWKLPGWIVSMMAVAMIERASISYAQALITPKVGKFFLWLNLIELALIMTITITTLNFKWVEFHSGYGLLAIVLPFHFYVWYRTRDRGSLLVMIAVGIASLAALVFMNKVSVSKWFNYLDISHVIMAVGAYVFYLGAKGLKGQKEGT